MFHRHFGGVFHLLRGAADYFGISLAAIEQATPTSPWQPTSAPEIEALVFIQNTDDAGGEQKIFHQMLGGMRVEFVMVMQYRRNDAGCAVGRRGDHPAAGSASFTAIAYTIGQSWVFTISVLRNALSLAANCGARRRTFNPPGNSPSEPNPRLMQASIASATPATRARTSASLQLANAI